VDKEVLVLDTSGFISGVDSLTYQGEIYTTPNVAEEIKGKRLKNRFQTAVGLGRIKVKKPNRKYFEAVKKISASTGDILKLSEADVSILALALQLKTEGLKPVVVSDDYSVQNVAEHLDLRYEALVGKIKSKARWLIYCSSCGKSFGSGFKGVKCPICGGEIKRKMTGKTAIRR
jgi:UPF0271 protein